MAEFAAQTTFILQFLDFAKDKLELLRFMGGSYEEYNYNVLKVGWTLSAIFMGCVVSKPFNHLRTVVESTPKNRAGERLFTSYAEAWGKYAGEYYSITQLYQGFWRYFWHRAPPLFVSLWVADSLGMFTKLRYPNCYLPDEDD